MSMVCVQNSLIVASLLTCILCTSKIAKGPSGTSSGDDTEPEVQPTCQGLADETFGSVPRRILVVVKDPCIDFEPAQLMFNKSLDSIFKDIVKPWRRQGHNVDVAISSASSKRGGAIYPLFSPVFTEISNLDFISHARTNIDSLLYGLRAIQRHGGATRWDFVAFVRSDIQLKTRISEVDVDFDAINFSWREAPTTKPFQLFTWERQKTAGDALLMFNSMYLPVITQAAQRL
eukprot:scaffold518697_cov31-Prasinocladus_malaysianus.AAC.1